MWCLPKKSLHEGCRTGRRIVADSLIYSCGLCECDGYTVHKLSQRRLTADWLAPRESDCSRMHSNVSSDWLPSYVHQGHAAGSRGIQNGRILSGQPSCVWTRNLVVAGSNLHWFIGCTDRVSSVKIHWNPSSGSRAYWFPQTDTHVECNSRFSRLFKGAWKLNSSNKTSRSN